MEKENINNNIEDDLNRRNRNWDKISDMIDDVDTLKIDTDLLETKVSTNEDDIDALIDYVGDLETLTTDEKSNIVGALNEIDASHKTHMADDVSQGNPHGIDAKANKIQEPWKTPELLNGWKHQSPIRYRKTEFNELVIRGRGRDGVTDSGTDIFILPAGYRVPFDMYTINMSGVGSNMKPYCLLFKTTGEVRIFGESPSQYIDLNNITIPLEEV